MQPQTSADALSQLQSQESSAQDPNAILQAQNQSLGVNSAQQTVQGLQGAINNTTKLLQQVAPSVMGRTQNSLVTDAQATKQVENEQAPLNTTLSNDTTQYNQAGTNLQNLENEAQTAATGIYQGQQDKISYAQNLYNNLYTQEQNAAQQAEAEREFNADLSEKQAEAAASDSSNSGLSTAINDLLGQQGSSALPQGVSFKNGTTGDAGYDFNLGGTAVSAAKYAQQSGTDLRNLLYNMSNSGDKTAGQALTALIKSNGVWTPAIQNQFSSIFWGV